MPHVPDAPEPVMARAAVRFGATGVLPAVALALWLRGPAGAVTALGGVALVVGWFVVSGASLAWAARRSLLLLQVVAIGGFAFRLVLLGLIMVALEPVAALDAPVLAVTVAVGMVALLVYEVRFVLGRAELWWLRPAQGHQGKERA